MRRLAMLAAVALAAIAALGYVALRSGRPDGAVHDARYLEFQPSPDHDAVDGKGVPIVQRYILEVYATGASEPVQKIDLGKPAPTAGGVIRLDLASLHMAPLPSTTTYEASIIAVGPSGRGGSDRSNRFTFRSP